MEAASQLAPLALGDQIRAARDAADLTQAELAAILGCSVRSLQGWEAGRIRPQARRRRLLTAFLDGTLTSEAVA